jgi:RNA polymerase sigma-70 factor, ECF subfamily
LELSQLMSGRVSEAAEESCQLDEHKFFLLYQQTARPLFSYLVRAAGNADVARDLLQESYCRLLASKPPAMDQAQTKSYLFRIATNLLADRWRSREAGSERASEGATLDQGFEAQCDLRSAFRELKPKERQLLWLAYVEGASHKEIAQWTRLRPASIRQLLLRARRKLASMLEPRARKRNQ